MCGIKKFVSYQIGDIYFRFDVIERLKSGGKLEIRAISAHVWQGNMYCSAICEPLQYKISCIGLLPNKIR